MNHDTNNESIRISQRCKRCTFDSPGLPNDSAGYPGLIYSLRGTTPSVLRFFWLIRHERFHCKRAFIEKAQHLWRWISLRLLTRGWRGTSQPRAIKGTTRTELHHERIYNGRYINWNIGIFCYLLIRILASIVLQNVRFNAVGVALLIAQGCQTIVQATLG